MSCCDPTLTMTARPPSPASSVVRAETGITIFGCGPDEAAAFRAIAPRFGVRPWITDAPVSPANAGLAGTSRCVSVGHQTPVTHSTLRALRRAGVTYLCTRSVGFDHIDTAYARSIGITVGNVTYSPDSVADYALMLMLMAIRDAKATIRQVDRHDYRLSPVRHRELRDLTVGVIGTGRIGRAVMERLRGFGCRVLAYDRCPDGAAHYVPLDDLLDSSDIVTLHTPLTPDTHHLLDRRRIARLKPGAWVINTARGALLDTEALIAALETGRLGGAALDVLEGEAGIFYTDCRGAPPANAALLRLQTMPNVLVSPHTAYYTDHALRDAVESTIVNCLTFERENPAWTG